MNSKQRFDFALLFGVIFLDLLGLGIMIPALAPLMLNPATGLTPLSWSPELRNIVLGCLIATYPFAQFFGSPILGSLSDRYGRKPLLMGSIFGTMLGYLLFAWGVFTANLPLLFVSRALDGFTGGNISIANSAIADMSTPETRARNFGMIGTAFGLGFILGPFIGGKLSDPTLVSWFSASTPFLFAGIIAAFNLILISAYFKETLKEKSAKVLHLFVGFEDLLKAWRMKHLRGIFSVIFFHTLGFCFFTQFFPVTMVQKFAMNQGQIGNAFAYVGLWIAFSQGVLPRLLGKKFPPERVLKFSLLGLSATLLAISFPTQSIWIYIIQPFTAAFEGLSFPNSTALVSKLSSEKEQGEAMGVTQSLRALGQAVPPLLAGFLVNINQNLPTFTASALILLAWLIFVLSFRTKKA